MTQAERDGLNKRIAEDLGWTFNDAPEVGLWVDPDGSWRSIQLRDFTTDPAMTLLLMGKIVKSARSVSLYPRSNDEVLLYFEYAQRDKSESVTARIGEAVALAYAAMRNLK